MFKLSVPTKAQVVHGLERSVLVFVAGSVGDWVRSPNPFSKAATLGAVLAGATLVYQAVVSTFTTL